jgi:predicted phage terminase large subunit-like protein
VHQRRVLNAMVFMPPGSAKSTYASVVYPAYAMGKRKGSRVILASYASAIAWKQSRRTRQIVKSAKYRPIFDTGLRADNQAVEAWALDNGSEYMAGGILAGMTGNRATDLIIDDPVAGREEADSETMQKRVREAYEDDLSTRLMPGGSTLIIQTRWNENDLSGGILPSDWSGESGMLRGRDGQDWFVLCVPAIADRADDPLKRKPGDRLWPEWFTVEHFDKFKANSRTWNALFQQKPTADEGDFFKADYFQVRWAVRPSNLRIFGASDYAVTPDEGDFTEHGIFGLDDNDVLHVLAWWSGQTASDVWIERMCDLIVEFSPQFWVGESGVIRRAVEPYMATRMQQRKALTRLEWLPSTGDKEARARGAQAMASMGRIRFPMKSDFHERVIKQLMAFPAGAFDDAVDVISIAARALPLLGRPRRKPVPIQPLSIIDPATGLLG